MSRGCSGRCPPAKQAAGVAYQPSNISLVYSSGVAAEAARPNPRAARACMLAGKWPRSRGTPAASRWAPGQEHGPGLTFPCRAGVARWGPAGIEHLNRIGTRRAQLVGPIGAGGWSTPSQWPALLGANGGARRAHHKATSQTIVIPHPGHAVGREKRSWP